MNKFYVIANSQKDMDFAMADKISEYIILYVTKLSIGEK